MDFKGFYDEIIFDVDRSILKSYTGKQGDTKSRGLYVTVTQKNAVIDDLTGLSMRFFYEKPDKTRGFIDGVVDGNKFRIDYTNQIYAVPGVVKAELRLTGPDGEIITAKTFKILVDGSIADGSIVSKNERGILDRAFELAEDIVPRIELLDVELLENIQTVLPLEVAKIKKELSDYKATMAGLNLNQEAKQQATGYGTISLPPNAAEGQVSSVGIKGLTATNLIKNGNFAKGATGWNVTGGYTSYNIVYEDKSLSFTKIGEGSLSIIQAGNIIGGHKYYISGYIKSTIPFSTPNDNFLYMPGTAGQGQLGEVTEQYTRKSYIRTRETNESSYILALLSSINPPMGATVSIKDVMVIDLTATFGAGNEPTKEECDQIFANWFDGTKSTVGAVRIKSVGKNLFDKKIGRKVSDYTVNLGNNDWGIPIRLQPNTSYTITRITNGWNNDPSFYLRLVKSDGSPILNLNISGDISITFITDSTGLIYLARRYGSDQKLNNLLNIVDVQIEKGDTATPYEPYIESNAYVVAKDSEGKIAELRSLPNGTKDEINVTDRKLIKRIGEKTNVSNGTVINYTDMAENGTYYAWNEKGETETGTKGDTLGIDATTLTYQLAEPIEIPVQVSGTLLSYPSGTVYVENVVTDAGLYSDGITVLHQDLPIKSIEKISKIDYETGLETILDASKAVIASDKLSFTHPDLKDGDIVFFIYEYDRESTIPEVEVEFYDSRYVVKDTETGKFYKWNIVVANGQPSIELVEV